jgi:hypothetical protein
MNWRKNLESLLLRNEDKLEELVIQESGEPVRATIDHPSFTREFDGGFGCSEGCSFTAWGEKYVYFPAVYDGSEWIECVPRNPCLEATFHIGGQ